MDHYSIIKKAIHYLEDNYQKNPSLEEISQYLGLSPTHFQKVFTLWAGVSPKKFQQFIHLAQAKKILRDNSMTLLDASVDLGLSGTGRLHDLFVRWEGMTPGEFKTGGLGLNIFYTDFPSIFGHLFIASTDKGICYAQFTDDKIAELENLKTIYPNATLKNEANIHITNAKCFFENPKLRIPEIRVHLRGTNFQIKIWEALLKIPQGKTTHYGDLAKSIGSPNASRAVGSAIGKNPIAFLIPCHRVIQSSGKIGEYHWGSDRKTMILGWEAIQD